MSAYDAPYFKLTLGTDWWFQHLLEDETELIDKADWAGLVRVREADLARDPGSHDLRLLLAVAHARAGSHDRALRHLTRLHRLRPWDELVQDYALESLFASGRTEHDFPWIDPPLVARIEEPYLARLHELMLESDRWWPLFDLMLSTNACAFLTFDDDALLAALEADPRFAIRRDGRADSDVPWVAGADPELPDRLPELPVPQPPDAARATCQR